MFRQWLNTYIGNIVTTELGLRSRSIDLVRVMVSGSMSSFAQEFGNLILNKIPSQLFGSKEIVYLAYVCAFLTAAAEAMVDDTRWEVEVECFGGVGHLDLVTQREKGEYAVIQEHRRIELLEQDKQRLYGESQCKRLTRMANEALEQIQNRRHRNLIRNHVTELREFGIAFLGPYCAVVGNVLTRKCGGEWTVHDSYTARQDEARRAKMYSLTPGMSG